MSDTPDTATPESAARAGRSPTLEALDLDAIEDCIREGIYGDDRQTMTAAARAVDALSALVARVRALEAEMRESQNAVRHYREHRDALRRLVEHTRDCGACHECVEAEELRDAARLAPRAEAPSGETEHPEARCQRCGRPNVVWFAPNDVWDRVIPEDGILCPVCFIQAAERAGIQPSAWRLSPEESRPTSEARERLAQVVESEAAAVLHDRPASQTVPAEWRVRRAADLRDAAALLRAPASGEDTARLAAVGRAAIAVHDAEMADAEMHEFAEFITCDGCARITAAQDALRDAIREYRAALATTPTEDTSRE